MILDFSSGKNFSKFVGEVEIIIARRKLNCGWIFKRVIICAKIENIEPWITAAVRKSLLLSMGLVACFVRIFKTLFENLTVIFSFMINIQDDM